MSRGAAAASGGGVEAPGIVLVHGPRPARGSRVPAFPRRGRRSLAVSPPPAPCRPLGLCLAPPAAGGESAAGEEEGGKNRKRKKKEKKRKSGKPTKKNEKNKTKTTEAAGGGALPGAERGTGGRSPVRCVLSLRAARTRPAGGAAPALGLRAERLPPPNAPR